MTAHATGTMIVGLWLRLTHKTMAAPMQAMMAAAIDARSGRRNAVTEARNGANVVAVSAISAATTGKIGRPSAS